MRRGGFRCELDPKRRDSRVSRAHRQAPCRGRESRDTDSISPFPSLGCFEWLHGRAYNQCHQCVIPPIQILPASPDENSRRTDIRQYIRFCVLRVCVCVCFLHGQHTVGGTARPKLWQSLISQKIRSAEGFLMARLSEDYSTTARICFLPEPL